MLVNRLFTFTFLFFCILYFVIKTPITQNEIRSIGNGFAVVHNIMESKKFAVLYAPLSSIISYLFLSLTTNFEKIYVHSSNNYNDIISYIYALNVPEIIGNQIINSDSTIEKISIRLHNIILILILIYYRKSQYSILLLQFSQIIAISTFQVISVFLMVLSMTSMRDILQQQNVKKFSILGLIYGLLISASGCNGLFMILSSMCAILISHDMMHKKHSKGFKIAWIKNILVCFIITLIVIWIAYGMDLVPLYNIQNLFGLAILNSIAKLEIVPFFDIIQQAIFEVLFRENKVHSIMNNMMLLIQIFNINLIFIIYTCYRKPLHEYSIFSYIILFCAALNIHNIQLFIETTAIILTLVCTWRLSEEFPVKNLAKKI